MKLSINNKIFTTTFKKIKFYNLIIKVLLNQNLTLTNSLQYLTLQYISNLTQLNKTSFSKYVQPFNFSTSSRSLFQKNDFTSTSLKHKNFLKNYLQMDLTYVTHVTYEIKRILLHEQCNIDEMILLFKQ